MRFINTDRNFDDPGRLILMCESCIFITTNSQSTLQSHVNELA